MSKKKTLDEVIEQCNIKYKYKFNYDHIKYYENMHQKIEVFCYKHGFFKTNFHSHLNKGRSCKKCAIESVTDTNEKFIKKANIVHCNIYDYSKVNYINSKTKVIIGCKKHGDFEQKPVDHINSKQGCPICRDSKGEKEIYKYLINNKIIFDKQKTFSDCKSKSFLMFDFYLPEHNVCIEYDGEQHFRSIPYWGGDKKFEEVKYNDNIKNEYCKNNNIKLIRISYKDFNNIQEILNNI